MLRSSRVRRGSRLGITGACNILLLLQYPICRKLPFPEIAALTLLLLMLRVRADDHNASVATDNLALLAHGLYRWSNFHVKNLPAIKKQCKTYMRYTRTLKHYTKNSCRCKWFFEFP